MFKFHVLLIVNIYNILVLIIVYVTKENIWNSENTEAETKKEKERLHTSFINDHCFVNFGEIVGNASIELFLKVGAVPSMRQKSSKKAGTHFFGLILNQALQNVAVHVEYFQTQGLSDDSDSDTTVSESDNQEPRVKAVHLKCLMCDQKVRINTTDMYNQCEDAYKKKFL